MGFFSKLFGIGVAAGAAATAVKVAQKYEENKTAAEEAGTAPEEQDANQVLSDIGKAATEVYGDASAKVKQVVTDAATKAGVDTDALTSAVTEAGKAVGEAGKAVGEAGKAVIGKVQESAPEMIDKAKEKASDVVEQVKTDLGGVVGEAKDAIESVTDTADDAVDAAAKKVDEVKADAEAKVEEVKKDAADAADSVKVTPEKVQK